MPVTSNDIANQAIFMMGDNQPAVTGQWPNFDTSAAGKALNKLYGPCVQTVMREFEWEFTRFTGDLTLSGNAAPTPWAYEYIYPANCIEIWQVIPATLSDQNNPLPTNYVIANAVVSAQQTRVIQTNVVSAKAVYNNYPNENTWDAGFREAMVRLLVSELAMAVAGKPDTAQNYLESHGTFTGMAQGRDG